jgi:hypothetical protein
MSVSERDYLRLVALGQLLAAKTALVQARDSLHAIEHPMATPVGNAAKLVLTSIADIQDHE